MRTGAALALLAAALTCGGCGRAGGSGLFQQYEYEEEMYLSLDGRATIYVNGSAAAFNALRGTSFDEDPRARFDAQAVRAYFSSPITRVTRVSRPSRRNGRRYIHVRVEVDDVRRLGAAAPFAWSSYRFDEKGALAVYQQTVGKPAGAAITAGWTGNEMVAFRMHVPSVIVYHNTGEPPRRGNILVWEQSLSDRLRGVPLTLDARMETKSILYTTLFLFAGTVAAVAVTFALLIWWVVRRPNRPQAQS